MIHSNKKLVLTSSLFLFHIETVYLQNVLHNFHNQFLEENLLLKLRKVTIWLGNQS